MTRCPKCSSSYIKGPRYIAPGTWESGFRYAFSSSYGSLRYTCQTCGYYCDKGLRKNAEAEAERLRALLTDAVSALEDLGACGDADCTEPNCLHILPRAREALRAAREREG